MTQSPAWPLQVAVFQRLANDGPLNNVIEGVYDYVPQDTPKPYVTIGEQTLTPFDTKTSLGDNITLVLHCWSDYKGKSEAYNIIDLMLQALSKAPLDIEGAFSLFHFQRESGTTVIQDIDGETYHGILRVRCYINQ